MAFPFRPSARHQDSTAVSPIFIDRKRMGRSQSNDSNLMRNVPTYLIQKCSFNRHALHGVRRSTSLAVPVPCKSVVHLGAGRRRFAAQHKRRGTHHLLEKVSPGCHGSLYWVSFALTISSNVVQHWYIPLGTWKHPFHFPPFNGNSTSPRLLRYPYHSGYC